MGLGGVFYTDGQDGEDGVFGGWIPACAGMTVGGVGFGGLDSGLRRNDGLGGRNDGLGTG